MLTDGDIYDSLTWMGRGDVTDSEYQARQDTLGQLISEYQAMQRAGDERGMFKVAQEIGILGQQIKDVQTVRGI